MHGQSVILQPSVEQAQCPASNSSCSPRYSKGRERRYSLHPVEDEQGEEDQGRSRQNRLGNTHQVR